MKVVSIFYTSLFLFLLFLSQPAIAAVRFPSIFTDNLVLQQKAQVPLWGWASANKTVSIITSWNKKKYTAKADENGSWRMMVATPAAGGPYTISFNDGSTTTLNNILIGEVWLCSGQSNMEMPMKGFKGQPINGANDAILKSTNKNIRLYTVPRSSQTEPQENSKPSSWKEASPEPVSDFSATAFYFGQQLYDLLQVPIGLINVSYGGSPVESWMSAAVLKGFPEITVPQKGDSIKVPNRTPTTLFNGMLHPVIGYGIKGAIWYQGESNYDRPDQYEKLFPTMVQEWRNLWQQGDFPFYYVQIAPYNYAQLPPYNTGGKYNSAYLRDAQRKSVSKINNSDMAVLLDAGEEATIHPAKKEVVGKRLALLALGKTYSLKGFGFDSPAYDTMTINGNIAEVKFSNAGNWLTSYGRQLTEFEIAGKDGQFYPAQAVIYRSSVMVSSPQVKEPVAVRYAFKDFVVGELFSTEGFPVSSFRTDNW